MGRKFFINGKLYNLSRDVTVRVIDPWPWFWYTSYISLLSMCVPKKVREKSRECHNHKPQPFPDPKRKRKPTNLNKLKLNKRTKSTKISSLFPKRGNRNTKRTEKHNNKMTHGKTYNKSPRRINHKATNSKTNTGTTTLERSPHWGNSNKYQKHMFLKSSVTIFLQNLWPIATS